MRFTKLNLYSLAAAGFCGLGILGSSFEIPDQATLPSKHQLDQVVASSPVEPTPQIITVASKSMVRGLIADTPTLNTMSTVQSSIADAQEMVINKPGASFIKVHFSALELPEGAFVTVSNPDGSQVHRYGNANPSLMTNDVAGGDNGESRFSALSIIGDTAIVRVDLQNAVYGAQYKVEVDYVMEGFSETQIEQMMQEPTETDAGPMSTCGVNERRDVQCWANSHPTEFERSRPVARLLINGSGLCTAWRVGSDNHMFTNEHCVASQSELSNTEVWFNYQRTGCGSGSTNSTSIVTGNTLLASDYTLDYTLFTVNNFNSITSFGHFGLDVRDAIDQELIYIPQHGSGNPKELAIESDQNVGGLCRVDSVLANGRGTNTDMGYKCDTIGGSSGSPVLASSTNNVIALHHFGGCENQGVRIKEIWPQVSSYFGGQIPVGDNQAPTGDPVASFSFNANALTVVFSDSSSDSDGSITNHSWNFGDGNVSNQQNPSHTYASSGTYSVTLTVTDNDGKTDSSTQNVSVSDGQVPQLSKGVPVTGLSGSTGDTILYAFDVPADASNLSFNMSGGSGDADIYVRFGEAPTTSTYDCRPYRNGNSETCSFSAPQTGTYYVMVRAYSNYSGVSLVADYSISSGGGVGIEEPNLSGSTGNWKHFTLDVPAGASTLQANITGGSGDADLYVNFGSQPTTSTYQCRPYRSGNVESCTINNPNAGTWYISVRAYSTYSGVTLTASAQ